MKIRITLNKEGLQVDGVPFSELSPAEQLRVSMLLGLVSDGEHVYFANGSLIRVVEMDCEPFQGSAQSLLFTDEPDLEDADAARGS